MVAWRSMKRYSRDKLAAKLIRYFISSTFIPFLLIVTISASLMDYHYKQDILLVTDGYLESLATNVSLYIKDLQQVALLPYFSNEVMTQIQRLSKEDSISFSEQARLESALDSLLSSVRYTRNDFYSALIVKDQNVLYSSSNYINSIPPIPDYDWAKEPCTKKQWKPKEKLSSCHPPMFQITMILPTRKNVSHI